MSKVISEYNDLDKYKYNSGNIYYCKKDTSIWHNPYGPATIYADGSKSYFINGKIHRLDGPAIILINNQELYYINGKHLSKDEFEIHPERLKYLNKEHLLCLR